jgi:hypothetical protein
MMTAMFHVFVEGAKDTTPAGLHKLAEAIAARYGLKPADLLPRLQSGRFRVKANVDRATAETYVRDLDQLGARCVVEAANAQNSRPTPLPFAAATPTAPTRPTPPGQYSSGLAAAFSSEGSPADAGAFDKLAAGAMSLASVDGRDGAAPAPETFAPPEGFDAPASIGPPRDKPQGKSAKPAKPSRPKDEPVDLFVPPEAQGAELKVELADDSSFEARKRAATPPAAAPTVTAPPARPSAPQLRASQPWLAVADAGAAPRAGGLANPRVRLVAGVVLAILLGFVPVHFIAAMRERSAFAEIDRKVDAAGREADITDDALDARRAALLDEKYGERRTIAIMAILLWGAASAGVAFVWFKKLPWQRVGG